MVPSRKIAAMVGGVMLLAVWAAALPAAAISLPPNQLVLGPGLELFHLVGQDAAQTQAQIVLVQGQPFDRAWRIEVRAAAG